MAENNEEMLASLLTSLFATVKNNEQKFNHRVDASGLSSAPSLAISNSNDDMLRMLAEWMILGNTSFNDRVEARRNEKNIDRELERLEDKAIDALKENGLYDKAKDEIGKFKDEILGSTGKKAQKTGVKAVEKTGVKAVEKTGVKAVEKTGVKASEKVATKAVGKAVGKKATTKAMTKIGGKAVGKTLLKKVPVVSAFAGAYFAVGRCLKGEWKEAVAELGSGIAGCFPGVGTAVSVAIDAGLVASDISKATKSDDDISIKKSNRKGLKKLSKEIAERGESIRTENARKLSRPTSRKTKLVSKIIDKAIDVGGR